MTQLILDINGYNLHLPESVKGGYTAYEEDLAEDLIMIAGNMVKELRGAVWRISYQYGYFDDAFKNNLIAACIKGRREPIMCAFLPPNGNEMVVSEFFVTSFNFPKFMWSKMSGDGAKPLWGDFSMELREVETHD